MSAAPASGPVHAIRFGRRLKSCALCVEWRCRTVYALIAGGIPANLASIWRSVDVSAMRLVGRGGQRPSVFGAGAPTYPNSETQKEMLLGRLEVAARIAARSQLNGDLDSAARWRHILDELLDRLLEVRGR